MRENFLGVQIRKGSDIVSNFHLFHHRGGQRFPVGDERITISPDDLKALDHLLEVSEAGVEDKVTVKTHGGTRAYGIPQAVLTVGDGVSVRSIVRGFADIPADQIDRLIVPPLTLSGLWAIRNNVLQVGV